MFSPKSGRSRVWLMLIAAFALFSLSCGLINQALDAVADRGLQAVRESEFGDQVFSFIDMIEGESVDLTAYEIPGMEFLFEVDPFDDVIRWRFYAINAEMNQLVDQYREIVPDYLVETDEQINGARYVVLTARHLLSSIYSRDQLQELPLGYQQSPSTLLDVELLNSSAHQDTGRLAITTQKGLLASPIPEDTTLVIFVYNLSGAGISELLELVPGNILDSDTEADEQQREPVDRISDDYEDTQLGDDDNGFGDLYDDENREVENLAGLCEQSLASGPCYHPYIPVVEGFTRSYQTEEGLTTETVTEVRADGFTVETVTADGNMVSTDFYCTPEGVAGWNFDESLMETLEGVPSNLSVDIQVDGLQLPREIEVGNTWSLVVTATVSIQAGGVESMNIIQIEMDYTAVGEETITTPAGRYNSLRVEYVSRGNNTLVVIGPAGSFSQTIFTLDGRGAEWYVACLGRVRSEVYSRWTGIATVESHYQWELTDYGFH